MPSKSYYERHREELKAKALAHHYANRNKRLAQMRQYRQEHKTERAKADMAYYHKNRDKIRKQKISRERARNAALRQKIFSVLGNKCVKCGFRDWRALQIDHINGGGGKETYNLGAQKYYRMILAIPELERNKKYQILCANCNWIKKAENNEVKNGGYR